MSDSVLVALIGLAGSLASGLLGAFGSMAVVEMKGEAENRNPGCGLIGLATVTAAVFGLIVGLLLAPWIINRLNLGENLESTPSTISSGSFTVQADERWQDTGIQITKGDYLQVEYVSGEWTGQSSSSGYSGPDFGSAPENTDTCFPIQGEGSSLIGKVGSGAPFKVGYQYLGYTENSGRLYLRMNDCDKFLFDNDGATTVEISVE